MQPVVFSPHQIFTISANYCVMVDLQLINSEMYSAGSTPSYS